MISCKCGQCEDCLSEKVSELEKQLDNTKTELARVLVECNMRRNMWEERGISVSILENQVADLIKEKDATVRIAESAVESARQEGVDAVLAERELWLKPTTAFYINGARAMRGAIVELASDEASKYRAAFNLNGANVLYRFIESIMNMSTPPMKVN
jgi:hypothetical protein